MWAIAVAVIRTLQNFSRDFHNTHKMFRCVFAVKHVSELVGHYSISVHCPVLLFWDTVSTRWLKTQQKLEWRTWLKATRSFPLTLGSLRSLPKTQISQKRDYFVVYFQRDFGNVVLVITAQPGTLVWWEILDKTSEKPGSILKIWPSCLSKHHLQHLL